MVVTYIDYTPKLAATHLLFTTSDPHTDSFWSDGLKLANPQKTIDPDLFWDDDGTAYMASGWGGIYLSTISLSTISLSTGATSPVTRIWNGTGGSNPEGPHIYKKDGLYYLVIAEGGSGANHAVTIARSASIFGPYESYAGNPILTNRGTEEYFQTVGHADLFQDKEGEWWGAALATVAEELGASSCPRGVVVCRFARGEAGYAAACAVGGEFDGEWGGQGGGWFDVCGEAADGYAV